MTTTSRRPYIFHEDHDYLAQDIYLQLSFLLEYLIHVLFSTSIPTSIHNLFFNLYTIWLGYTPTYRYTDISNCKADIIIYLLHMNISIISRAPIFIVTTNRLRQRNLVAQDLPFTLTMSLMTRQSQSHSQRSLSPSLCTERYANKLVVSRS